MSASFISLDSVPLIVAFLTGVVGPALVTYIKYILTLKKTKDASKRRSDFNITIETQKKINDTLNCLQSKHNIDRIWIAQFHNGGNFYPGGKSMKKMSATFESTKPGVSTDFMKLQNLPVSFFSSVLQNMNENKSGILIETDETHDNAFKDFWLHRGVIRSYMFPIYSLDGDFIAILAVDFNSTLGKMTEEIYSELDSESKMLSGYVSIVSIEKN